MRPTHFTHLGVYSDLITACSSLRPLFPSTPPGRRTQQLVHDVLGFSSANEKPRNARVERRWRKDGLEGEEISWSVGYGPRTRAWLLRPSGVKERLPGVIALHDHGGFKFFGKEKIADGPLKTPPVVEDFRKIAYGGRPFANELAREGFVVLVPDIFLWGSRRFPSETIPEFDQATGGRMCSYWFKNPKAPRIARYNSVCVYHEHTVAKYCSLLGTTFPGIVAYEDRVAANYLAGRRDVCTGRIGCVGLSGGGSRSTLLQATCDRIRAAVVVGMMSDSAGLLDHNVVCHTWMIFPPGWGRHGDWADLAACRAPSPLLVQYDKEDLLFTMAGMKAAHQRIARHYRAVGAPANYRGEFYPGPHKFDARMQAIAFAWLKRQLAT